MATLYTVLTTLQQQISAATTGLISLSPDTYGQPLTVEVGLYWPSAKALQNNVRKVNGTGPTSLVTVYDRGLGRDSTRWSSYTVSQTPNPATMTVTLSDKFLQPGESLTITFGGTVSAGDAVGLTFAPFVNNAQAVVVSAGSTDTPETMAAQAAMFLQANPTIAGWGTISVAGPVVTLVSTTALMPAVTARVGNGGTSLIEIGRRSRHFQVVVWSRTPDDRITVGDPIEAMIASMEANFGLTFPDGTMGRLLYSGDIQHDEATLSDTLRRDFLLCVDYGITVTDTTYAFLAPIVQNTSF